MDPCDNFTDFGNLTMFLQEDEDLNSTVEEFQQNEIAFSTGEKIFTLRGKNGTLFSKIEACIWSPELFLQIACKMSENLQIA